ncbi:MAG: glycosyltransferase, partial [Desulfuromonadales bacterium]|nr:glycosyltransferase [Desulfuromonadales bacterium]
PANLRLCGAPLYDGAEGSLPEEVESFLAAGEAPILFALGSSAVWTAGDFWRQAAVAASRLGRRAMLITGPEAPGNLPAGIKAFSYLPYSKIFPRGAAVVHSAGIGTLAQAMRSGRPQLLVPVAFDQPDNAFRAAGLGLGRVLPFGKVDADRLVPHLVELLSRPDYGRAAEALARQLRRSDGAANAAAELEACLRG